MTNAFGRGLIKISDEGTFKALKKLYVKKGADWKDAQTAWVKQNGEWIQIYPTPKGQLTFDPPTLNFEAANGYESPTQYVSITNIGDENVIIEDFSVSYTAAGKFVTFFDLTELGGQIPATIAPGETKRLGIAIDAGSGAAFVQQDVVTIVDTPTLKTVQILNPLTSIDVDYLVVAGGGGGGSGSIGYNVNGWTTSGYYTGADYNIGNAGGGGGGGVVVGYKRPVKRGETVQIKVGQGGAGKRGAIGPGASGGNSSFGDIVAIGGGGGAGTGGAGQPGGSGGGGGGGFRGSIINLATLTTSMGSGVQRTNSTPGTAGAGTPGQGYPGSPGTPRKQFYLGYTLTSTEGYAAGGGGAGGTGSGTNGGPGRVSTITGTRQYYGGGGGGSTGNGGVGGGGGSSSAPNAGGVRSGGIPGTPNTGGGGGGMLGSNMVRTGGGDGGSGIVVVKYDYDKQLGDGGTVTTYTTDDGVKHWVHTFTQDGAFTYREVLETVQITVIEQVGTITQQLGMTNTGELGSSESTIRMKTNVGAFGTQYSDYTIFGEVIPPYAEADVLPGLEADLEYFRYNPRQTRTEFRVKNIGNGSLIITSIEGVGPYFNVISYPDAIAPREYGIIVIESRVDDNVPPGIYTDVITVKSNNINGDIRLTMTLDVMFPEGNTRISTAGIGKFIVPEGVYRLSEVRVIGGGGGGGQGFNQQAIPPIPNPNPSIVVDYLVVGGGGSSGSDTYWGTQAGGGGGGGVLSGSTTIFKGTDYSIIVGAGGGGGGTSNGSNGGSSSFAGVIAKGGGGSAGRGGSAGNAGASGGGGIVGAPGGVGTPGQGYPGGSGDGGAGGGGGGGGAGGAGSTYNGGPGIASTITGTTRYYGGGGAGRSGIGGAYTLGVGGIGGGGGFTVPGTPGTGGGAGGGGGERGHAGGSGIVILRYQNAKQISQGGTVTSYTVDGNTYWVHSFTSTGTFTYTGISPVLFGGVGADGAPIIPGAGSGGGGGSGSIVSVANVDVMPGEVIEYVVGRGGAGVEPILSTTNPAPAGKPGETTSFNKGLVAAGGGLGGGGGGPNTGGVGAGNTPNPVITGISLVPRTLSWAWGGHMNAYAVWDNYSDAANSWYTFRKFTPTVSDNYTFYLSCDNYGIVYLNGPAILSTTSFGGATGTTVYIQKDTVNIIGMYAQNWGGPCGYALNIVDSAGKTVWDTRSKRAAESVEAHPSAVSRKGGIGQNGTAGVGDGGHGGSNTFGLGGDPGLYNSTPIFGSIYLESGTYLRSNPFGGRSPGTAVSVGTDSFTFECWVKVNNISGIVGIYATSGGPGSTRKFVVHLNNGIPSVHINNESTVNIYISAYAAIVPGAWTHIAFVRNSGTCTWFINGIASGTGSNSTDLTFTGQLTYIGYGGETYFPAMAGYISNVRLVKSAVYTTNFTPATDDLVAIQGTALLLAGKSGFMDISAMRLSLFLPVGPRAIPTEESPFANRPVSPTNGGRGRGPGTGGGGGASGIDGKITPASGPGADGEVYIAWGPIIPRDPPANLIAHFVVSIEEQRMYDRVLPYCNPYVMQVSGFFTEKNRPYALFNGTSANYIGTPADAKYDLVRAANSSFTIEAWVILKGTGSAGVWGGEIINRDAEYEVAINGNDQVIVAIDWGVGSDVNLPGSGWIIPPTGQAVVPRNVPTHVAVVANQSTLLIYINGTLAYTTGLNRVARRDNTPVWIGNRPGQNQGFNGGISDVRIWNVARTQAQIQANMAALVYNTPQGI